LVPEDCSQTTFANHCFRYILEITQKTANFNEIFAFIEAWRKV